jgi:hypothetical protein
VSLEGLFGLSDRVQQYATAMANGKRTCQACGHKAETLLKCARCTLFWYCDKVRGSPRQTTYQRAMLTRRVTGVPDEGLEREGP